MKLSRQVLSVCFFLRKNFEREKHKTSKKELIKQKQVNKKQQKQQNFAHKSFIRERKLFVLCFDTFFSTQNFFLKKNKQTKNCLDSLIYYTTDVSKNKTLFHS